jgi:hypothetical protein
MPHRRFLLDSLAYPLSSNIRDVARMDYGRYGRINSPVLYSKILLRRIRTVSCCQIITALTNVTIKHFYSSEV